MGFYLYHNKKSFDLEIGKIKDGYMDCYIREDEIVEYNDVYMISDDRKMLREKAIQIKEEWISELNTKLEYLSTMKVKNKY